MKRPELSEFRPASRYAKCVERVVGLAQEPNKMIRAALAGDFERFNALAQENWNALSYEQREQVLIRFVAKQLER